MHHRLVAGIGAVVLVMFVAGPALAQDVFTRTAVFKAGDGAPTTAVMILDHEEEHVTKDDEYWIISVIKDGDSEASYTIVFGPDPTTGGKGRARIRDNVHDTDHQDLYVQRGVGYYFGTAPYGGSDGGSGVGDGTIFFVWGRPGGADDYFVYLGLGNHVDVYSTGAFPSKQISNKDHYLEVTDAGNVGNPLAINKGASLADLRTVLWETLELLDVDETNLMKPLPF